MSQTTKLDSLDLYVPEYCVQGERIPFYILWDNNKKILNYNTEYCRSKINYFPNKVHEEKGFIDQKY